MRARGILAGYLLGVATVVGCASAHLFPWNYYAQHLPEREVTVADVGHPLAELCYREGVLWGKQGSDGWPDLALKECEPDPPEGPSPGPSPVLLKCITTKVDDFYSIKADDLKCHEDLDRCEHNPQPGVGP